MTEEQNQEQKPLAVGIVPQGTKVCFHGLGLNIWRKGIVVDSDALHIRVFFKGRDPEIETFTLHKRGHFYRPDDRDDCQLHIQRADNLFDRITEMLGVGVTS